MPRSKYTAEEKLSILTGLSKAGLSKKDYCQKHGIGVTYMNVMEYQDYQKCVTGHGTVRKLN